MRVLIVSDIHANLEAFQSVIDNAGSNGGFDQIWELGDLVGYGPDPDGCIDLRRQHAHVGVAGNHDLAAVGKLGLEQFNMLAAAAARWTAAHLSDEQAEFLRGLPLREEIGDFTAVHGSPRDPVWEYLMSRASATANFGHFNTRYCLVGHTHVPFVCRLEEGEPVFYEIPLDVPVPLGNERCIINPGSVGQPRDGVPTASYLLHDSDAETITHHRASYDIPATQQKMRDIRLPDFLIERLAKGK